MPKKSTGHTDPGAVKTFLLFLGLLLIGSTGYFVLRGHWAFYFFAHLGALGVMGLFGVAAAAVARKKGRSDRTAFLFGFAVPIVVGVVAVFLVRFLGEAGTPYYCGGSVSLMAAILIIGGYLFSRKRLEQP